MTGKIVRLVRDRGFGFIRVEGGKEVFFHHTAVQEGTFDSMTEGGTVEFDMGRDSNSSRERAINVRAMAEQGGGSGGAGPDATEGRSRGSSLD